MYIFIHIHIHVYACLLIVYTHAHSLKEYVVLFPPTSHGALGEPSDCAGLLPSPRRSGQVTVWASQKKMAYFEKASPGVLAELCLFPRSKQTTKPGPKITHPICSIWTIHSFQDQLVLKLRILPQISPFGK